MSNPSSPQSLTFENEFNGSFTISKGTFSLTEGKENTKKSGGVDVDPDGFLGNPTVERLIQVDQPATITLTWTNGGTLRSFIAGQWRGEAFLEKMGSAEFPGPAPSAVVKYDPDKTNYAMQIQLKANSIDPGMYRIVVCLTFEGNDDPRSHGPVAAFGDLGLIKFYHEEQDHK